MKTVLILGGGIMQIPAVKISKEKGWRVVLADRDDDVPGRQYADHFEQVDLKDRHGMLRAAGKYRNAGGLDGVFTAGTDFSATVAWVAEKLGLPGISYETALNATDKTRMRSRFHEAGVPSPSFVRLLENDDPPALCSTLVYPLVVKPVDNMGARGIRKIMTEQELLGWLPEAFRHSRSGAVIVEEYIDGPEFSIDAIVEDERITVCGFADRHITFAPYFVEMGHTIPSNYDNRVVAEITATFCQGVKALGITIGAAKGDVKYSGRGPVIGEIAARLSGGYMSGWTYPYCSGHEVTEAALNLAVGLPAGDLRPKWEAVSAERAFISIPGVVDRIFGVVEAERMQCVKKVIPRVRAGDRVLFPTNNVQKCGNIISQASDRRTASAAAETAARRITIRLRPGEADTEAFLFGRSDTLAPVAFLMGIVENRQAFTGMPDFILERGEKVVSGIGILGLPDSGSETGTDWHGESFKVAFEYCVKAGCVEVAPHNRVKGTGELSPGSKGAVKVWLGKLFWRAFLRGGRQGGIWVVDTVQEAIEEDRLKELLGKWCDI